ncbi:MAG: hypothetical protein ACE5NP_09615 [Anaerolineae bacterium]
MAIGSFGKGEVTFASVTKPTRITFTTHHPEPNDPALPPETQNILRHIRRVEWLRPTGGKIS